MIKNNKFWYSIIAITIGLFFGLLLLLATGQSIGGFWISIYQSSFQDWISFGNFLSAAAWIALIALAFTISFRAGVFNIGAVGQFIAGGLFTYAFIQQSNIEGRWAILITLFLPVFVGMIIAWLIAFLKTQFKIHEVLSSIFLNLIIFWLYKWFTSPIHHGDMMNGLLTTPDIAANFSLRINAWTTISFINYGIIFALFFLILFTFMYKKTTWGYTQDILASKNKASIYVGINFNKEFIKTMVISGAMAGLAGGVFYFGYNQNLPALGNDIPGEPWLGLTVALIAFNNPLGIILGSLFIGAIENAKSMFEMNGVTVQTVDMMMAIWIILFAISYAFIIYNPQERFIRWLNNVHGKSFYPFKKDHQKDKIKIKNNFSKYLDYIRITKTTYDIKGKEYKKRDGK